MKKTEWRLIDDRTAEDQSLVSSVRHHQSEFIISEATGKGKAPTGKEAEAPTGNWRKYTNIDMCFQGDTEIIGDWKRHHT